MASTDFTSTQNLSSDDESVHRDRSRRSQNAPVWLDEFGKILDDESQTDINVLKSQLREQLTTARDALNDAAQSAHGYVRETVNCAVDCADDYVATRPWRAIGYAAGMAFLLGLLAGRNNK